MVRAVKDGPGQVIEAGVDQIERILAGRFHRADFADEIAALSNEEAAWFELKRNLVAKLGGQSMPGRIPQLEVGPEIDVLLPFFIRHRQTTTGADGDDRRADRESGLFQRDTNLAQMRQVRAG